MTMTVGEMWTILEKCTNEAGVIVEDSAGNRVEIDVIQVVHQHEAAKVDNPTTTVVIFAIE